MVLLLTRALPGITALVVVVVGVTVTIRAVWSL